MLEKANLDSTISEKYLDALKIKAIDEKELKAEWNSIVPSIISSMELYDEFDNIGEDFQKVIRDGIAKLDITSLSTDRQNEFASDPRAFIRKMFLDPISDGMLNSKGTIK
jgi:hypothetical protein